MYRHCHNTIISTIHLCLIRKFVVRWHSPDNAIFRPLSSQPSQHALSQWVGKNPFLHVINFLHQTVDSEVPKSDMPLHININKSASGRSATSFLLRNFFGVGFGYFTPFSGFSLAAFLEVGACEPMLVLPVSSFCSSVNSDFLFYVAFAHYCRWCLGPFFVLLTVKF